MSKLKAKWLDGAIAGSVDFEEEVPSGTVDGVNFVFTLSQTPVDMVQLTLNSRILRPTIDYVLVGDELTLTEAPAVGQELYAIYI